MSLTESQCFNVNIQIDSEFDKVTVFHNQFIEKCCLAYTLVQNYRTKITTRSNP